MKVQFRYVNYPSQTDSDGLKSYKEYLHPMTREWVTLGPTWELEDEDYEAVGIEFRQGQYFWTDEALKSMGVPKTQNRVGE